MVREARFAWDADYQQPEDLTRSTWDCDDPEFDDIDEETYSSKRNSKRRRKKRPDGDPQTE